MSEQEPRPKGQAARLRLRWRMMHRLHGADPDDWESDSEGSSAASRRRLRQDPEWFDREDEDPEDDEYE